ncbi:MAG TPA: imidazolonepropionase [Trueperaceae bacterium]
MMRRLFRGISELYTPFTRVEDAVLAVEDGTVAFVGPARELPGTFWDWPATDIGGHGVLPGLVDSHTHLVWAGDRLAEYHLRARGAAYEEILQAGGGIYNTVRATTTASEEELLGLARERAHTFLQGGVTALEVKSGYGLEFEQELKMLRVVNRLAAELPQHVVPTLLAHVIPRDRDRNEYVAAFTRELIPEVARSGLARAVDVFCDAGAYTLDETRLIFEAARAHGLGVKAHAEQLTRTGATALVAEFEGLSADHLEQTTEEDWRALAAAGSVATLLPGATVLLRKPFPSARAMWDAGVKVAVATDHNPGSSPFYSLFLAMQLAIALGDLTVEEALVAGTAHTADALDLPALGRLEKGSAADFIVTSTAHATSPLYTWGTTGLERVYTGGEEVWPYDKS